MELVYNSLILRSMPLLYMKPEMTMNGVNPINMTKSIEMNREVLISYNF